MSRRRLLPAPIDQIDCVVTLTDRRPPFRWDELFGRSSSVELEIGCGKGLFLAQAGQLRPEADFLGVEKAGKYFRRAVHRIWKAGLPNVRLLEADAFDVLERWIPEASLAGAHVYFPDPWPKKRHARRRLLQPALYRLVARALSSGAPFRVASDVTDYFHESVVEIEATPELERIEWPENAPDRQPTSYAIKYREEGRSLHYAKFRRRPRTPADDPESAASASV